MIRLKKTLVNIFFILLSFCFISCSNDEAITQNVSDNAELEYAKENSQLKKEILHGLKMVKFLVLSLN